MGGEIKVLVLKYRFYRFHWETCNNVHNFLISFTEYLYDFSTTSKKLQNSRRVQDELTKTSLFVSGLPQTDSILKQISIQFLLYPFQNNIILENISCTRPCTNAPHPRSTTIMKINHPLISRRYIYRNVDFSQSTDEVFFHAAKLIY